MCPGCSPGVTKIQLLHLQNGGNSFDLSRLLLEVRNAQEISREH